MTADHDEDDNFGDFEFAPSVLSINSRQPAPPTTVSSYSDSFPLFTFDPVPPDLTPASPKPRVGVDGKWQKPSGPLPLSLFGRDDEQLQFAREGSSISLDPPLTASSGLLGSSSVASSKIGQGFPPTDDLKDLIAGLYVQQEIIHPYAPETGSTDNLKNDGDYRSSSDRAQQGGDGEEDFEESCWEFKDAFSASTGGELVHSLWAKREDNSADISQLDQVKAAGHGSLFQACSTSILNAEVPEVEVILEVKPIAEILSLDLQQERACILSHTTANGFSNGYGSASSTHPKNEPSSIEIGFKPNINIQHTGTANSVLESKDPFTKIETINGFPATKAEKDLSPAMWIFEHSSSINDILVRASSVEQLCYICLWSKMASVCDEELNHGATIWTQAVSSNVQMELLHSSQGQQYILALGEIYRVAEILSAASRLYKPWILVNPSASEELLCKISKSAEVWKDSGLKHALELISSARIQLKALADELIESINSISMLNEETMQKCLSCPDVQLCMLSLLPLDLLPDIAPVVWEDNLYFCKVANLWVNRISLELVSDKDRLK